MFLFPPPLWLQRVRVFQVEYNYKYLQCPMEYVLELKRQGQPYTPMLLLNVSLEHFIRYYMNVSLLLLLFGSVLRNSVFVRFVCHVVWFCLFVVAVWFCLYMCGSLCCFGVTCFVCLLLFYFGCFGSWGRFDLYLFLFVWVFEVLVLIFLI